MDAMIENKTEKVSVCFARYLRFRLASLTCQAIISQHIDTGAMLITPWRLRKLLMML